MSKKRPALRLIIGGRRPPKIIAAINNLEGGAAHIFSNHSAETKDGACAIGAQINNDNRLCLFIQTDALRDRMEIFTMLSPPHAIELRKAIDSYLRYCKIDPAKL